MPVMGRLSLMFPVEPENLASPKEKIPPSEATSQQPAPDAGAAVPAVGARRPVARAGPVTDPSRLRTPATSAADRSGPSRPGTRDWRRRERTGIDPPEAPVCRFGRAPPRGDSRGRDPLVGGLRVERGGEGDRLGRRVVAERT